MLANARIHLAATIDDFERPNSPAPWTFYNGAEFPGATGSLSSGTGRSGKGARLEFNFGNGGNYVSADYNLPSPLTGTAVGFWIKSPGSCKISLRVRDTTGQTLQYDLWRPPEAADPNRWSQHIVDLSTPTLYFGGDGTLHGGIVWVSIMANNLGVTGVEAGLAGAIDFDDVTLTETLSPVLDPFTTPLLSPPPGKGNLMSDLGVMIHFPNYPQYTVDVQALDAIQNAGFSWIRKDLFWSDVERTRGVYDFSLFDTLLDAIDARGLKALFILDYSNELHSDCPPGNDWSYCFSYGPQSAATIKAFGDYAEAAAKHFAGRGVRFQLWNEPNHPLFWRPTPNANQYDALAREAIARVHAGDPAALVSSANLSTFDFKFLRDVLNLGGISGTNAIGVHPYRRNAPESATDELVHMRSIVHQALSPSMPIWDTEWGYSSQWYGGDGTTSAARHRQAVMVVRKLLSVQVMGFPLSIYYDIRDDGTDPTEFEHHFGLLANNYSEKPAMLAVRTLRSASVNRTWVGSLQTQFAGLHALRLDGASDAIIVLWLDQAGSTASVTLPAPATATDMFGAPLSLSSSNGRVTVPIRETDGPVYVTLPLPKALKMLNISTRLQVLTADRVLIGGFIITGNDPKKLIIRGIGPSMNDVSGTLADPTLQLYHGDTPLATNDNWKTRHDGTSQQEEIQATTIPPPNDSESALVSTLAPGAYTVILEGKNGGTGVGVVEAYDLSADADAKLANISTRGFVNTGDGVMIAGLIVSTTEGSGTAKVIVRAIGPSLPIQDALSDPTIELYDGNGTAIAVNDDWKKRPDGSSQQSDIEATTIPPINDAESAVIATLGSGSYTAIVRGKNLTTGVALVEIFNIE